jgi:hypothetical protein
MDDEEADLYFYRTALFDSLLYTVALVGVVAIIACLA